MPYLVWGGISLAIGIISYFIPADNLNVATDGLYSSIIGVFKISPMNLKINTTILQKQSHLLWFL
ncbi:hypothetical protein Kyoto44A_13220 [Helicobacter pylori]